MEDPQAVSDVPQVAFKKRNAKSKSSFRKRAVTPPPASDSDSGISSSEDEEGRQIKRRKKNAGVMATSATPSNVKSSDVQEKSNSTVHRVPPRSDDATKASNWYDEDAEGDPTQNAAHKSAQSKLGEGSERDGTYKGVANYTSFIKQNPNKTTPKHVGPVKSSTNVRTITVTDFAPDVCKDYKQTGFCGFGDSCKFLHAREDYKQGWELDRDWEIGTKGKKIAGRTVASANRSGQAAQEDEDDDALLESIPFACIICKEPYKNPIVTKCGHYFCEACALKRYRKDPSCAACGAGTGGVFNTAKKLNRLLERKRERAKKRKETAQEGEGVSEGDDES